MHCVLPRLCYCNDLLKKVITYRLIISGGYKGYFIALIGILCTNLGIKFVHHVSLPCTLDHYGSNLFCMLEADLVELLAEQLNSVLASSLNTFCFQRLNWNLTVILNVKLN